MQNNCPAIPQDTENKNEENIEMTRLLTALSLIVPEVPPKGLKIEAQTSSA